MTKRAKPVEQTAIVGRVRVGAKPKSIFAKKLTREERRESRRFVHLELFEPRFMDPRPRTRGECIDGPRPCPWVSCRHNLYLDVNPESGSIKVIRPDMEPGDVPHSCALDIAEQNGLTSEELAQIMNMSLAGSQKVEREAIEEFRFKLRHLETD